ncbi:hypothetical protein C8R44DRAFT_890451 [Mycena epipterygia]|nr:hypothetical protein C8R44DRAFT_890451 [Mycena epipterygia]
MSKRAPAMQFIDDRADVDHDEEEGPDDDPDSMEALARAADQRDFPMREFEAGHQARLESAAPYRLPESQYTPQTPLFLPDPQDRATPTPPPAALPQSVSAESSQAERLTASKRELGSDDNASSPPKRRRVQQKSIAEFFDTAAEESEEEGVSEEEDEEDEETLSDQEFLDDEPTHDSPAFYHNLDQDNAADEIAAAEFSAARLDQAAAGYSKAVEAERRGKIPPPALIMPDAGDAGQCSPGASDWMQRTISNAPAARDEPPH